MHSVQFCAMHCSQCTVVRMREISFCLRNAAYGGLPIVGTLAIAGKICSSSWIRSWAAATLLLLLWAASSSSQINWLAAKIYSSGCFPRKTPNWLLLSQPPIWSSASTQTLNAAVFQDTGPKGSFMNICFMHPESCVISALHAEAGIR